MSIIESKAEGNEHYLTTLSKKIKEIQEVCNSLLPVPDKLSKPHPLVKSARGNLNTQKKVETWHELPQCISTDRNFMCIKVQKHNVPRALRIMDALIKMVELRGHYISVENETKVVIDGEKFPIRFREKCTRQTIPNTQDYTDLIPNNKLSIKYDGLYNKEWVDKSQKLEEQLPKIIAYFELRAVQEKREKERQEIAQLESARRRETEQKIQAEKEREIQKEKDLISYSQKWSLAETLRDFIREVESRKNESQKSVAWIKWAKTKVDKLDPLSIGVDNFIEDFE